MANTIQWNLHPASGTIAGLVLRAADTETGEEVFTKDLAATATSITAPLAGTLPRKSYRLRLHAYNMDGSTRVLSDASASIVLKTNSVND
jgi:hypothetical protein